jgi:hypothetical protein
MADQELLQIEFPGLSAGEAARDAQALEDAVNGALRDAGLVLAAKQHRTGAAAQDLGTVVQILLAAPATVVLFRGIALGIQRYLSRSNRTKVKVTRPDGTTIEITDAESRDADKVIGKLGLGGGTKS